MKSKTINSIITKKMNGWFDTIEDPAVRELAQRNTIVTGGCIASMLLNEKINDFDLYFRNKETALALARYYLDRFEPAKRVGLECQMKVEDRDDRVMVVIKSAGIASENGTEKAYEYFESRSADDPAAGEYVGEVMMNPGEIEETYEALNDMALEVQDEADKPKHRPIFMSTNAVTLSGKIQLIIRFFGDPDQIHENYDFVHCTNYWTSWEGKVVLRQPALESLLTRELFYVGSKYPVCSIFRLRKFLKRGWFVNAGQMLKIMMQISALDLTKVSVLQDQLTGVDCAYFTEVIGKLKDSDPEVVNSAYLIEIIDRMF